MLRRPLVLVLLLLPTFVSAAETAAVSWHDDRDAAVAAARAQQKMLLVYDRGTCGRCSAAGDAMFERAASDDIFRTALDSFVPLRVSKAKAPQVAIHDTGGVELAALSGKDLRWDKVGELLLRFRAARPLVAAAAELRQRGDQAAVAYALGQALMAAREPKRAVAQYDLAVKSFGKERAEDQQFAQVMG